MLEIAIIGAGQIGSRHLQALALLEEPAKITLVDPSETALQMAFERFQEVVLPGFKPSIVLHSLASVSELDFPLDVAIMATGSKERAALTMELLNRVKTKFMIFEKFLFPRLVDYTAVEGALERAQTHAWVNQWISSTYVFKRVGEWIAGPEPLEMRVHGEGWGLCCNAVHHMEYFDYLTGRQGITLEQNVLESGWIPAKRPGYREVVGSLFFSGSSGSSLELSCHGDNKNTAVIKIDLRRGERAANLQMKFGQLECVFNEAGSSRKEVFTLPPQSRLTHRHVHQLMNSGTCELPAYERSSFHHQLVLEIFMEHFAKSDGAFSQVCPIT